MARKPQGDKNRARKRANRTKVSYWSYFKSLWYNAGVRGYSLLTRPPTVPYNGVDTVTLSGLAPIIAWGVFPATIIFGILRILGFIYPAVKVLGGAIWEAISQNVVSLVATFFRMDKSPQVLDRRIQLWLFIQSAFSSTTMITLWEDIKTFFWPNSGQARWGWFFLVLSFVAAVLTNQFAFLIPDTIVINMKVYFVTTVWSLELLGAGKSFRYGQTLKPEFSFTTTSTKTDRVQALVNRVVLSPVKTASTKFVEASSVISFIRVRIPTKPRFRASFRFGVSKVVIARCTPILIYGASWIGILGPVYMLDFPEDLVVFFAVVNMVSSLIIALTFIITSNLKTANA